MSAAPHDVAISLNETALRRSWGWFVGLGALAFFAGLVALGNQMAGTVVSVLFVGFMMGVAGIAQIAHAFQVRDWGSFAMWLFAGLLYTAAAALIVYNPVLGATVLTLFLGASLILAGGVRLGVAIAMRDMPGWIGVALSAAVTLLLGIMITAHWPTDSLWVLGLFLGIDLTFTGAALIALGLQLRPAR
jgi:uncharacterized membrane protein HdeD (DUF308 family)